MPMAEDAERVQQNLRKTIQHGIDRMEKLRVRDGVELAQEEGGYLGYIKDEVRRCEEDE